MNVIEAQHAVYLRRTHKAKHMHICRSSMAYCTSTTLSNMWAKGRKEMSTSLLLGFRLPWTTTYTGGRGGGRNRHRRKTEEQRHERQENIKRSKKVNLSQTGILDFKQGPLNGSMLIFYLFQISRMQEGRWFSIRSWGATKT